MLIHNHIFYPEIRKNSERRTGYYICQICGLKTKSKLVLQGANYNE